MIQQDVSFNVTHFELAILLVWVVEGSLTMVVGFWVALDLVKN
jgi:hypothetical protein